VDDQGLGFSVALVVTTRSRHDCLADRLPVWSAAGFDEMIVVDGTYDPEERTRIRRLCGSHRAIYVGAPPRFGDTRSLSRNIGARTAKSSWVLFQDDDDDAVMSIDRNALSLATRGKDWLAGNTGEIIVWHRREAFLRFGGYPEDMVAAEDWIMSNRARHGVGGREPVWYRGEARFAPPREEPLGRTRNAFWYGYTLLLFLLRCPKKNEVIRGDAARIASGVLTAVRRPRAIMYLTVGLLGRFLSPVHCIRAVVESGIRTVQEEPLADWQGIRPE